MTQITVELRYDITIRRNGTRLEHLVNRPLQVVSWEHSEHQKPVIMNPALY
jgi:hypothetical protein